MCRNGDVLRSHLSCAEALCALAQKELEELKHDLGSGMNWIESTVAVVSIVLGSLILVQHHAGDSMRQLWFTRARREQNDPDQPRQPRMCIEVAGCLGFPHQNSMLVRSARLSVI